MGIGRLLTKTKTLRGDSMSIAGIFKYEEMSKEIAKYVQKPTKAGSKRLRALNNEIRKGAAQFNKQLIEADKAGYSK